MSPEIRTAGSESISTLKLFKSTLSQRDIESPWVKDGPVDHIMNVLFQKTFPNNLGLI